MPIQLRVFIPGRVMGVEAFKCELLITLGSNMLPDEIAIGLPTPRIDGNWGLGCPTLCCVCGFIDPLCSIGPPTCAGPPARFG